MRTLHVTITLGCYPPTDDGAFDNYTGEQIYWALLRAFPLLRGHELEVAETAPAVTTPGDPL